MHAPPGPAGVPFPPPLFFLPPVISPSPLPCSAAAAFSRRPLPPFSFPIFLHLLSLPPEAEQKSFSSLTLPPSPLLLPCPLRFAPSETEDKTHGHSLRRKRRRMGECPAVCQELFSLLPPPPISHPLARACCYYALPPPKCTHAPFSPPPIPEGKS